MILASVLDVLFLYCSSVFLYNFFFASFFLWFHILRPFYYFMMFIIVYCRDRDRVRYAKKTNKQWASFVHINRLLTKNLLRIHESQIKLRFVHKTVLFCTSSWVSRAECHCLH